MKKLITIALLLFVSTLVSAHNIYFLGCVDGKLKFRLNNGPSGGFVSVKIVDNNNNVVSCAVTAPFNKNTTGTSVEFEVLQNETSCKSYTKVYAKWSKDGFVNTYKVDAKDYCKATLPIKVYDFYATRKNDLVNLSWKTRESFNFFHFEIEAGNNLGEFSKIGSTAFNYFSTESTSEYFRLKQVDLDGSYQYSKIVFIKKDDQEELIKIQDLSTGTLYTNRKWKVFKFN